jgi:hypothetical protein
MDAEHASCSDSAYERLHPTTTIMIGDASVHGCASLSVIFPALLIDHDQATQTSSALAVRRKQHTLCICLTSAYSSYLSCLPRRFPVTDHFRKTCSELHVSTRSGHKHAYNCMGMLWRPQNRVWDSVTAHFSLLRACPGAKYWGRERSC